MFDLAKSFYRRGWNPDRSPHIEDIKKRKRGEHPDGSWWHGQPDRVLVKHRTTYRSDGSIFHKPVYRVKCGRREW